MRARYVNRITAVGTIKIFVQIARYHQAGDHRNTVSNGFIFPIMQKLHKIYGKVEYGTKVAKKGKIEKYDKFNVTVNKEILDKMIEDR